MKDRRTRGAAGIESGERGLNPVPTDPPRAPQKEKDRGGRIRRVNRLKEKGQENEKQTE